MQKKCRQCGDTFTVRTYEDYCPECEKVMTPPGVGVSKELTCEGCGETFVHKKEKAPEKKFKETLRKELDAIQKEDMVNHPTHYTRGKIEVIDFIEDQQLPYHLGNVIKYIARAGYKGDKLEDLKKARWYLDRYINEVMGNGTL
jgi:hypothetical protein